MIPRAYREITEPGGASVERLVRAFSNRSTHARLAVLPEPRARTRIRLAPVLLAALVVMTISSVPLPIDARLDGDGTRALTPDVTLVFSGSGSADGSAVSPRIVWEAGTLDVAVAPDRGVDLVVETAEGTARVHGTHFVVTRDALGTTVAVIEGRVFVSCGGELGPGDGATCLPRRAAGWLARARALRRGEAAIEAVRSGLALAQPGDPARGELLALAADLATGDEAREAGEAYLREGYAPRAEQMRDFIGREP